MDDYTGYIKEKLLCHGADLVGIGDLRAFPPEQRYGMPYGIAIAVKYPPDVIRGIIGMPTKEYYAHYNALNERLASLAALAVEALQATGSRACTRRPTDNDHREAIMPHKTVDTRAGLGWIGKCALLVTREYGSAVRLVPIFTDAKLQPDKPVDESGCGDCLAYTDACPGRAVAGRNWSPGVPREEIYDAVKCRAAARARAWEALQVKDSICGRCIAVCPITQKYTNAAKEAHA